MTDLLGRIEEEALERLDAEAGTVEADIDAAADAVDHDDHDGEDRVPVTRLALACLFPMLGAAVMVGGVFTGVGARFWAAVGGILGMGLALVARRIGKPLLANAVIVVGLFAVGLVLLIPTGPANIAKAGKLASEAAASGDVLRPPVPFTAGWQALVGWLMGIVGFGAVWVATVVRKPALALLVPLPAAALAGISVPDYAQVPSGIAVLVLFAFGLGLLSSARQAEEGAKLPLGYELRKLAKGLPVIAAITAGLVLLAQTDFLFPDPKIDPAQEPQKPNVVPIDQVEDRVLFTVSNPQGGELQVGGPWRLGTLDVYDPSDGSWRLPAFDDTSYDAVPDDGVLDPDRLDDRGLAAEFRIAGLGGASLPGLPNTIGVVLQNGPDLAFDRRTETLRLANGQVPSGLRYQVAAAKLPTVDELRQVAVPIPADLQPYTEIPDAPPAVRQLLTQAGSQFTNAYDRFDFLRNYVLDNVTAVGLGTPVEITPERVQEILGDTLEASPYEIVALQAMLARWLGVPGRIGYGFDCTVGRSCDDVGGALEVRPGNGASWPEVWFGDFGWLPLVGQPRQAQPSVGSDPDLQAVDPGILPSADIAVELYLPALLPPPSTVGTTVRDTLLVVLAAALLLGSLYVGYPAARKALLRSRRRAAARGAGPRARIALAYAEWRDHAADFGFRHPNDTPLMYLDRFVDDAEHAELAWLTTRALWGDLQDACTPELAATAEELSRALRRRLSAVQPGTMRFVAAVSRLSLRDPFAPATVRTGSAGGARRRRLRLPGRPTTHGGAVPPAPRTGAGGAAADRTGVLALEPIPTEEVDDAVLASR
jgi:hypothetical protein